jgi:predicted peptidase
LFRSYSDAVITYPYVLYVPRSYQPSRSWPLILFLHGSGESGTDGTRQLAEGLGSAMLSDIDSWPFIVVFPQKPSEGSEWEQHEDAVMGILARVRHELNVDPRRIYLTGLSQGGHGAWVLGARHPGVWAAIAPICGYAAARRDARGAGLARPYTGSPQELAAALRNVPIWAFHGEADDVVAPAESVALVAAVNAAGGSARLTLYPGVGHGSWDRAYRTENLAAWFLDHSREAP